jgi:shikimate dehydrogenase
MGVPYAEVIGDPIAHSKSPIIHKFWLEKLGLDGDYRRAHVRADELQRYFETQRRDPDWRGCNVTIPHKEAVLEFLDESAAEAMSAGAVNAIVRDGERLVGLNTDVLALKPVLEPEAAEAALLELPVVLFGAGGAARAVLQAIRDVADIRVVIINRDVSKAETLLAAFGLQGEGIPLGSRVPPTGLVVNASSLGMIGFPPLPADLTDVSGALVYDLVYAPAQTELLRMARAKGLATLDGFTMLIQQARLTFQHFFRVAPPPGTEPELRELLTR